MKKNNLIVCGGTFDHLHKGHEDFLNYALSLSGKLIVGLTSGDYVRDSKLKTQNSKLIESYEIRKKSLEKFLTQKKNKDKATILKIDDLFGPTLSRDLLIDGIVVSQDTKKGAEVINRKRKELGLRDLGILVAPSVYAQDRKLISSARIRNGEINKEGRLCVDPLWLKTDLVLPEDLRGEFKKPFGELLTDIKGLLGNKNNLVITVGDITAKIFNEKSLGQDISVIDFKVAREIKFSNILELGFAGNENVLKVDNPAGYITSELFKKLAEIFKLNMENKVILQINGEEDLAVLPLILLAPLNTIICYGQPNKGLIKVTVSEEIKNKAYNLILKLKQA